MQTRSGSPVRARVCSAQLVPGLLLESSSLKRLLHPDCSWAHQQKGLHWAAPIVCSESLATGQTLVTYWGAGSLLQCAPHED